MARMPKEKKQVKDFFIIYNKSDREWAEWIAWQLKEEGYSTILQAWDMGPGSNFVLEMDRATREARRTIAVLSGYFLRVSYTQPEWAAAFAGDPTGKKRKLVPVRVRKCELEGLLAQIVYIDLVGLAEDKAKEALLAGLKRERALPATAPPFPRKRRRPRAKPARFPGALPSIWNVPHHRNPNFTGREELLAGLRDALTSGKATAITQAITGLGGVGKTQLAVEYAYRHCSDYSAVWWVKAEEPATLAADYAALAGALGLKERDAKEQEVVIEAVRGWLERNRGWLLVFDQAPGPEEIRRYLPRSSTGHVVVTSMDPVWRGDAEPLPVPVMPREEAVTFLLKRTGQKDEGAAAALAEELGFLPLALEQAGAYMEATGKTLSGYLALFRQKKLEILKHGKPARDYKHTVATTWETSFKELKGKPPADLMNLCAFLAPDDVPLDLIREGAEHLPRRLATAAKDWRAFDEAVAALRRYSLVEVGEDSISVHRLVQAVARERLTQNERKRWAEAAARVVNKAFPGGSDDVRTWPQCSRLLAHALAAAGHAEELRVAQEPAARLLSQVGTYLWGRAEYAQARSAFERALAICEAALGPDHPHVATCVNNLGLVLQDMGDLPGARARLEGALAIWQVSLGPEHPNVASAVNNLGRVLQDLGDLEGARAHLERAVHIDEVAFGPEHPNVARDVNNLGGVLEAMGDLVGARACFERALRIDEAAYGPDHPSVAIRVNNLGGVLHDMGDLPGARVHFERALKIRRHFLGDDHPKTLGVRRNLESLPS